MNIELSKEFIDDLVKMINFRINVKLTEERKEANYLVDYEHEFRRKHQKGGN